MIQDKTKIQIAKDEYESTLKAVAVKQEEIDEVKQQLSKLEIERTALDVQLKNKSMVLEAEMYNSYSVKDLLVMVEYANKLSRKEYALDFKQLVDKFGLYELGMNDITQLQTYIELYGNYVKEKNTFLKRTFKLFGGDLDE